MSPLPSVTESPGGSSPAGSPDRVPADSDGSPDAPGTGSFPVREVTRHTELTTPYGVTWTGYYRWVGVLGLCGVVGSLTGLPAVSGLDPLVWASGALAVLAGSTAYQLWRGRSAIRRPFRPRGGNGVLPHGRGTCMPARNNV